MKSKYLFLAALALMCSCNNTAQKSNEAPEQTETDTTANETKVGTPQKPAFDNEALKKEWTKAFYCDADCRPQEYTILDLNNDGTKELLCRDKENNRIAIFRMGESLDLYACNYLKDTDSNISFYLYNNAVVTSGGVSALAVETVVPFTNGDIVKYKEILGGMYAKTEMEVAGATKELKEPDFEAERAKYKEEITDLDAFEWVKMTP